MVLELERAFLGVRVVFADFLVRRFADEVIVQRALFDAAIDFVDAATLVDTMREAFFVDSTSSACVSTSTR